MGRGVSGCARVRGDDCGGVLARRLELPVRQRVDAGDDAGAMLSFDGVHDDDGLGLFFELLGDDPREFPLARETCLTALPVLAV